ncbi:hypothetical protein POM88_042643 [Heracleum sosnowskyi]|uniref:Uncharacterized protein n=1 Tax=Heracleum sosnowskyi TaxID=360622 RepID=A0AAD8MBV4_9APIA|nr:hypothetical protein POM88_042643 [Heracleum sosnowskyi]
MQYSLARDENKRFRSIDFEIIRAKECSKTISQLHVSKCICDLRWITCNEVVSRDCPTQIALDLRIDVWPNPFCWMLHGIWPAYVSGYWLVHYKLEGLDRRDPQRRCFGSKISLKLDFNTKETLREIWKSYGDFYEDSREHDMEFWAYQKVMHCWDLLNCPPGQYLYLMANVGKYVRDTLMNWTMKSNYTPNQFYTSDAIRLEMELIKGT